MPIPNGMPMDFKDTLNKVIMLFGIIIIIYAILWILAKLNLIPSIIFGIFPQIVLLLVGIFIFYYAWSSRNKMY
ncbi:hypothetical protein LJB96_04495 [Methanobrevibacter sp. OttesenSCG-928-K11]|nr:hypothetical protein [Methanobrevibacter sp. OttesenSCG-928-K11]MDL2270335.1 hypothetical protein [Methanobrevibacter sp. OttesenSCG-928-I08]